MGISMEGMCFYRAEARLAALSKAALCMVPDPVSKVLVWISRARTPESLPNAKQHQLTL